MLIQKTPVIRRVIPLVLVVALILPVLLAVPVSAETTVVAEGQCGPTAYFTLYDDGSLHIHGTGSTWGYAKSSYNRPWYAYCSSITSIVVEEGITGIGNYNFSDYSSYKYSYTSISLPEGLLTIGTGAFYSSGYLTESLVIPSTVTTIGSSAFWNCSAPTITFLPATPPAMSEGVFTGAVSYPNIDAVYVPESSLDAYKTAAGFSGLAEYMQAIPPEEPSIPTVTSSFAGQTIYLQDGSIAFYIHASNVNGTLTCQYYINGEPYGDEFDFVKIEDDTWLQGWRYTPVGDGTREVYAIVKNTLNGASEYMSTGTCTVIVGSGSGSGSGGGSGGESGGESGGDSEVSDRLDSIDNNIGNIQSSVDSVQDQVEQVEDHLEVIDVEIEDIKGTLNDVAEDVENLPEDIQQGLQNVVDSENEKAESEGNEFVDQLTGIVPNDSQGFIDALGSLVDSLSYTGTECVLPVPALTLPAISGLFPSYTVMPAQQVDFQSFFNMMPSHIILLVQSLGTVALIVFCFKELYSVISYFFVLKGGET